MKTALMILATSLACAAQAAEASLKLIQTIPLPGVTGRFDHFGVDVKGRRLFVAALGNNTLEVIDLTARKRLHSLSGFHKPQDVLYLPTRDQVFVANGESATLSILDGAAFKFLKTLGEMPDADNLRYDVSADLVYVGYGDGALAIVRVASAEKAAEIKLAGHPESFQLEQQGSRIFVNVPDAKQVAVIDREKPSVVSNWPMEKFQANFPMALDEANHRLFLGCRRPARVVVLDTAHGEPVADLAISGDTDDLFYDARNRRLYLSCGEGFIDVIGQRSPDSYQMRERIPTRSGARTSFFCADLDEYYLAVPQRGAQPAELRIYRPSSN